MDELQKEIMRQSLVPSGYTFACDSCVHYKGALICEENIFIAFKGANMSDCSYWESGKKCLHCGKVT